MLWVVQNGQRWETMQENSDKWVPAATGEIQELHLFGLLCWTKDGRKFEALVQRIMDGSMKKERPQLPQECADVKEVMPYDSKPARTEAKCKDGDRRQQFIEPIVTAYWNLGTSNFTRRRNKCRGSIIDILWTLFSLSPLENSRRQL